MKLCIHSELLIKWNFSSSCMYQIMVKKWYSNYYELVLIQNLHLISMFPVVMHSMKFYSSNSITLSEEHGHIGMKWLVWLSSLLRVFSTPVKHAIHIDKTIHTLKHSFKSFMLFKKMWFSLTKFVRIL